MIEYFDPVEELGFVVDERLKMKKMEAGRWKMARMDT